jgi:hypothetical protein
MAELKKEGDEICIGDVVAVQAVDWGMCGDQHQRETAFKIVHAMVYGEVIAHTADGEGIVIAPQVFRDGDVRCTLVIPYVTIKKLWVLAEQEDFT